MSLDPVTQFSPFTSAETAFLQNFAGLSFTEGDILYIDAGGDIVNLGVGSEGEVLSVVSGVPAWTAAGGGGDVTAASAFGTDNRLIRSDGTGKGVQASAVTLDDSGNLSSVGTLNSHTIPGGTGTFALTSQLHNAVTLTGQNYLSLSGQQITAAQINLATHVTGDLPFANIAQIATNRILGRSTAGTGDIEALADGDARSILGLATSDSPQFTGINLGHATDTTITRVSAGIIAVEGTQIARHGDNISEFTNNSGYVTTSGYVPGGTDVALSDGGTGASLSDPGADRIMFWDDSAGVVTWLTASTGLTISGTSMTVRTASDTQTGIVERLTDAEFTTGTDTTRYASAAQIASVAQTLTNKTITMGGIFNANGNEFGDTTEVDNGNSSTADTIDWSAGNFQRSTLTGNCTYTFTAPTVKGRFQLRLIQDATGSRTATWPASVKWPGGTAPTLSTAANSIDIISFYYDGTNFYGVDTLDFQ